MVLVFGKCQFVIISVCSENITWFSSSLRGCLWVPPSLSLGLGQLSPLSFLKSYTNRGKRLLHVRIGHTGHLGLVLAPELKKKKFQERKRERQIFLQKGCPAVGVILMGRSLAFESRPWEAAATNAERNKSVRLTFLPVLQWSCFCFLPPLLRWKPNFPVADMNPLTRNTERVAGASQRECKVSTFWPKQLIFSNDGDFRLS